MPIAHIKVGCTMPSTC